MNRAERLPPRRPGESVMQHILRLARVIPLSLFTLRGAKETLSLSILCTAQELQESFLGRAFWAVVCAVGVLTTAAPANQ